MDELAPDPAPRPEHFPPGGGETVEAAAPLARLFDPAARDPAVFLEPVEQGIEGGGLEAEPAVRSGFDDLRQLVAVTVGAVERAGVLSGQFPTRRSRFLL